MRTPVAFTVPAVLFLAGCGSPVTPEPSAQGTPVRVRHAYEGSYPIKVLCTTGMVADLVRNVGGARVEADQLMGEGVDPHQYKSSPGDVSRCNEADAAFYSGLQLEGKLDELFGRLAAKKPAFAVTQGLAKDKLLADPEGGFDPHVWQDVSLWAEAADVVRDVLAGFDPKHAAEYRKNAADYRLGLDRLHANAKEQLASIPKERRVLVTSHDAFRYFGRAYGVAVRGVQGVNSENEAGLREVNELVGYMVKRKVKAIFFENVIPERNVRAIQQGCKAKGHEVAIGGELLSDSLGKEGTPAGTYSGMVRHNVDTIVNALK